MKRPTTFAIGAVAVVVVAAAVISSSRAIAPRADESISPEDDGSGRVDVLAVTATTPPPCYPCWFRTTIDENFDRLTPPALPPDWLATNAQGPPPVWVTSNSGVPIPPADTPPNAVFIDDPGVVSDKRLDSFPIGFFEGAGVRLTFRHNFNLEASIVDPSLGYDGGVLEISSDGGNTFQDILAAGGSFVMGGYNRTISTDRGSPIAGRPAWSGNSEGFITTVVDVPAIQTPHHRFCIDALHLMFGNVIGDFHYDLTKLDRILQSISCRYERRSAQNAARRELCRMIRHLGSAMIRV